MFVTSGNLAATLGLCQSFLIEPVPSRPLIHPQHGYTAYDPRACQLQPVLYAEALRLWNEERHTDSITTLAAAALINMTTHVNGDEDVGYDVIHEMHSMAHRLELYGPTADKPAVPADLSGLEGQWLRARAHAAWGIFNYVT